MYKLLIVEDNKDIRQALVDSIPWGENDIEVIAAVEDGQQALAYLSSSLDVVITDIVMGKLDGIKLTEIILQSYPLTKIIYISAYAEFQYAKNAVRFGVHDYVSKPIENDYMLNTVLSAINERNNECLLRERVRKSVPLFREKLLVDLVMGEAPDANFKADCAYLGLDFKEPYYQCILFDRKKASGLSEGTEETRVLDYKLIKQIGDVFADNQNMIFSGLGGIIVLLYGRGEMPKINESTLYDRLEALISETKARLNVTLTVGIGACAADIRQISHSYRSALQALDSKFYLGYGRLYSYSDTSPTGGGASNMDEVMVYRERLSTEIKYGKQENINYIIDELDARMGQGVYDKEQIKLFLLVLSVDLALLAEEAIDDKAAFGRMTDMLSGMFRRIQTLDTKDEIISIFRKNVLWLSSFFQELHSSKSNRIIDAITSYIKRNYKDPDLNINKIASEVYMSPGYIGAVFKRDTEKSISEYIMETRVEAAKKLLSNQNKKVYEVSSEVGFDSPFYFSTCFKKLVGHSPNDYKSMVTTAGQSEDTGHWRT